MSVHFCTLLRTRCTQVSNPIHRSIQSRSLDMESIDALVGAVKDFRGGLIVVSHDQFFITNTCGELWVVGEGKMQIPFQNS